MSTSPRACRTKTSDGLVVNQPRVPNRLRPLVGGKVNVDLIDRNWADILRVAATMAAGTMRPSQLLRKLAAYPRQNELAAALREVGRINAPFGGALVASGSARDFTMLPPPPGAATPAPKTFRWSLCGVLLYHPRQIAKDGAAATRRKCQRFRSAASYRKRQTATKKPLTGRPLGASAAVAPGRRKSFTGGHPAEAVPEAGSGAPKGLS